MAFGGETLTDTLAAVVSREPDWAQLPVSTPSVIRDLLQRCLKKNVRQRLQAIGDARINYRGIFSRGTIKEDTLVTAAAITISLVVDFHPCSGSLRSHLAGFTS